LILDKKNLAPWGTHIIIDLHNASQLNDIELMKTAIHDVIEKSGSTLLFENFHHFQPTGITGIACLVESHITVHTWPDDDFAAFDIFMCGKAQPDLAIPILKHYFKGTEKVTTLYRGKSV